MTAFAALLLFTQLPQSTLKAPRPFFVEELPPSTLRKTDPYAVAYARALKLKKGEWLNIIAGGRNPNFPDDGKSFAIVWIPEIPGKPPGDYRWWIENGELRMMSEKDLFFNQRLKEGEIVRWRDEEEAKRKRPFLQATQEVTRLRGSQNIPVPYVENKRSESKVQGISSATTGMERIIVTPMVNIGGGMGRHVKQC